MVALLSAYFIKVPGWDSTIEELFTYIRNVNIKYTDVYIEILSGVYNWFYLHNELLQF